MDPEDPDAPAAADDPRVADFWNVARFHAKLTQLPGYFGPSAIESIPPPTWSFGDEPEGVRLLAELLSEGRSTSSTPRAEYDAAGADVPTVGTLGIVLDAAGEPQALVVTSGVEETATDVVEHLEVLHRAG